ncbi:hypothetical protein AA101099_0087 [Neoasaia chiangmaiensis NBRC 101099]|uniref:Peptidoglycan binding-like domain-containing protein n=1 Tax=Neoasaia chiangmaiensis TaxID=320497 RepID=A0A1U9KLS2_9PROT|nr:peptidoglycan-binding domain-containing protein [Neoasaia chiangmaiensis]AQS86743.1 hypothetical protein A0U93_00880 [Neoasaia chiangmaiensis]GBR35600.1 hypothetical protein AA101099_0087 [Neoasaia chiangmaiensis NBRC 101099]
MRQIMISARAGGSARDKGALRLGALAMLTGGMLLTAGQAAARPSLVTLIDLSAGKDMKPAACSTALSGLRDALDAIGIPTARPAVPTVDALRMVLLQLGNQGSSEPRMVVACAQGASAEGQLYLAPANLAADNRDLSRNGVSADTFARVAGAGGLTALDIVPISGTSLSENSGEQWRRAAEPNTSRLIAIEQAPDAATLIDRLTAAAKGHGDAMLSAFLGVQPAERSATPPPPTVAPVAVPTIAAKSDDNTAHPAAANGSSAQSSPTSATADTPAPKPVNKPSEPAVEAAAPKAAQAAAPPAATKPVSVKPAVVRHPPAKRVVADPAVHQVQLGLLAKGFYHGRVSGISNVATVQAIRHYQEKLGHQATGTLTPDEQNELAGK